MSALRVVKKLGAALLALLLVSFLVFSAFALIAGDPAAAMLGAEATPERLEALRHELGLDRPFPVRYLSWLSGFFTGELGTSFAYRLPVGELIAPKLVTSLVMGFFAFSLILLFSFPLGLLSAKLRSGPGRALFTVFDQIAMALPPFVLGVGLSWVFGVLLRLFTPGAYPDAAEDRGGAAVFLLFAALSLAVPRSAMTARLLGATLSEELSSDYARTVIAKGGSPARVLRHALKNALPSSVAFLSQVMAELLGGGIVVEQVFGIPGLGRLLVSSVANRDYPVVSAVVVILAAFVILTGALSDLIHRRLDPRLRGEGRA